MKNRTVPYLQCNQTFCIFGGNPFSNNVRGQCELGVNTKHCALVVYATFASNPFVVF